MILAVLIGLAGTVVVVGTLTDLFQTVIVPRPSTIARPSAVLARLAWRGTVALAHRFESEARRESILSTYAPAFLIFTLVFWIVSLALGFGLMFFALRAELHPAPESFWGAVYYAGTSLLTLGYGDITARDGFARALSLVAAATGLGTFAVVTAYLFALFAAFQRRESFIVQMRERTGAPPSGVDFIERLADLHMLDELPATFRAAETWMADMMETHLAYPTLSYFRSTHDHQSWVGTLGAVLDASALIATTLEIEGTGSAKMVNRLGRHLVSDYAAYFRLEQSAMVGIERAEFAHAYERLRAKGLSLRDPEAAWTAFSDLRATYAATLNAMARWWRIPPAQWIGDRSLISTHHAPMMPRPMPLADQP